MYEGYEGVKGYWKDSIPAGVSEISFEQFKKWVLKKDSMIDIQEEAKKRFPIGCKFKNTGGRTLTLSNDSYTYQIHQHAIFAHEGAGYLYLNGIWATLVSEPEKAESILAKWLRETKAKNLTLEQLSDELKYCDYYNIYKKLDGYESSGKAKILYDQWYPKYDSIAIGTIAIDPYKTDTLNDSCIISRKVEGKEVYEYKKHDPLSYLKEQGHVFVDADTFAIKVHTTYSLTLRSTESEVKIKIKQPKTVKI